MLVTPTVPHFAPATEVARPPASPQPQEIARAVHAPEKAEPAAREAQRNADPEQKRAISERERRARGADRTSSDDAATTRASRSGESEQNYAEVSDRVGRNVDSYA